MPAPLQADRSSFDLQKSTDPLMISFTFSMDPVKTEAAFKTSPPVPVRFDWQDEKKTMSVYPTKEWPQNQTLTASLGTGAVDASGRPILAKPFTFKFQTPYYDSYLPEHQDAVFATFGTRFQAVDASGRRAVQFVNQSSGGPATVGLTPLSMGEFARRYRQYQQDNPDQYSWRSANNGTVFEGLTRQRTWLITTKSNSFDELTIPADVPPGLYVLSLSDSPTFTDYLFLALTTRLLTVKAGQSRIYTWSTDFSGQPVVGMDMRLYGQQGAHLLEGQSDENGLWSVPISSGVKIQLALASRGGPQGISLSGDVAVAALDSSFITPTPSRLIIIPGMALGMMPAAPAPIFTPTARFTGPARRSISSHPAQ